ncbi:hypothetical protein SDC9_79278 [bioreactor metagenome]|uniref:Uncharacterized protein n=1 Tax=bioreactor metagenome TaxID=1076179 RepID=A0A644Z1W1_9ZZZZ
MPLAEETEHETNTILGAGGNFADSARRLLTHGVGVFCGIEQAELSRSRQEQLDRISDNAE